MSIRVEELTKKFDEQIAVNHISFELKAGEILGFLGPNGAGKTTVMRMLTGYLPPTFGKIFLDNQIINHQPELIQKRIGYLPEDNPLYTDMYIVDYLAYMAGLHQMPTKLISKRIKEVVQTCGLQAEKLKRIHQLSKGYKQRVGIAQALMHNPDILILDEPTTGLDPNQIVEIRNLIKQLGETKTIILSSHILPEVEATCDRILIINKGVIVANGTPQSLKQKLQPQEELLVHIEAENIQTVLAQLKLIDTVANANIHPLKSGFISVQSKPEASSRKAIFQLCTQHNWQLLEMSTVENTLEDIFKQVTL